MSVDLKARKAQLESREKELLQNVSAAEADARDVAPVDEARDAADDAVADEEREASYMQGSRSYNELVEVRAALRRIEDGSYGKCEKCGREISSARLDAVPATRYCVEDASALEPKLNPLTL